MQSKYFWSSSYSIWKLQNCYLIGKKNSLKMTPQFFQQCKLIDWKHHYLFNMVKSTNSTQIEFHRIEIHRKDYCKYTDVNIEPPHSVVVNIYALQMNHKYAAFKAQLNAIQIAGIQEGILSTIEMPTHILMRTKLCI